MNISLDYDNTFTSDPNFWSNFVKTCPYKVYCITSRNDTYENLQEIKRAFSNYGITIPIIMCNYAPKIEVCKQRGIDIDIWIDDDPRGILTGY